MSGEGEHPLSGKLNLCKSRKANSTPRLAWRHGIGGKRAAPGKLRLRLRWAQGMASVCPLWLAGVVLAALCTDGYGDGLFKIKPIFEFF